MEKFFWDLTSTDWQPNLHYPANINGIVINWAYLLAFTREKNAPLGKCRVSDGLGPLLTTEFRHEIN